MSTTTETYQTLPFLEFSGKIQDPEEWKAMSKKIREACETHGCFLVSYNGFPENLREEMFLAMKSLFDLPEETKSRHQSNKPYRSYVGKCSVVPLSESLGIDDAQKMEVSEAFTKLMWPEGNPSFCETINSMSSKMLELNFIILKMILGSFGMENQYDAQVEESTSLLRLMKYRVPPSDESSLALVPHTDKNALTILCQNKVQGLQILSKDGDDDQWIQVLDPHNAFIVLVGDALKAWSNGRLHAAKHRVVMSKSGEKERYSCGVFFMPKEGATVEVPQQLVNKEHPLLYKPFKFADFISYYVSNISDDALEIYAGV